MSLLDANFVGAQLYTVRDFTATADGLLRTLDQIASIGYRHVQFSAVDAMNGDHPAVPPTKAKAWLDQHGLTCCATHRSYDSLIHRQRYEVEFHQALGCNYAAIGSLPAGIIEDPQKLEDFFHQFVDLSAQYQAHSIQLGLHNHDWDIAKIIERAPHHDFQLELDLYWAVKAGIDLAAKLPHLKHRVEVIHIKDIPEAGSGQEAKCRFAAVGEGTLDWPGLIQLALQAGTKCFMVEQDLCPRDPFDCLRSSWNYLCL